jgi:hypothetical protein
MVKTDIFWKKFGDSNYCLYLCSVENETNRKGLRKGLSLQIVYKDLSNPL